MTNVLDITGSLDRLLADIAESTERLEWTCAACDAQAIGAEEALLANGWTPYAPIETAPARVCADCADVLPTASF